MGKESVLAIDLGTSRVKVSLYTNSGCQVARAEHSYSTVEGTGGRVEQEPADWVKAVVTCVRQIADGAARQWPPVVCSITGQMHGLVMLGGDGSPLRRAIICSDSRASQELDEIMASIGRERILDVTGNPGLSVFTGPKLLWAKKHEPEIYNRARAVLLPKDYIGYVMTGELATEPSDASGTMLYDYRRDAWDQDLCAASGAAPAMLPPIRASTDLRGKVTRDFAQVSRIPEGTSVVMGGGDLPTTVIGTGVVTENEVGISLGTAGIVFRRTDRVDPNMLGKRFFFRDVVPGELITMGSCPAAGFSVSWFRRVTHARQQAAEPGSTGGKAGHREASPLFYLPYLVGTGTPYMNYRARGAFIGLSPEHTIEHMERAVLEGVCFSLRQSCELVEAGGGPLSRLVVCGGGSRDPEWVRILANVLGRSVEVVRQRDTAVLGAAILGGLMAGWFRTIEEGISRVRQPVETVRPDEGSVDFYDRAYRNYVMLSDRVQALWGEDYRS